MATTPEPDPKSEQRTIEGKKLPTWPDLDKALERTPPEGSKPKALVPQAPKGPVPVSIDIKTLIVSPVPGLRLALGDARGLAAYAAAARAHVEAIVWNEERLALVLDDRNTEVALEPELLPSAAMFFHRDTDRSQRLRRGDAGEETIKVWEGDYEAVAFTKIQLLNFLRRHAVQFPAELTDAVKKMKVVKMETAEEELLNPDDYESENVRTKIEEVVETNLPRTFSAIMPIAQGWEAELQFGARVGPVQDSQGRTVSGVRLRCLNARQVKRDLMEHMLSQLPEEIPRFYGAARIVRKD